MRFGTEAELTFTFMGDVARARSLVDQAVRLVPQQRLPVTDRNWLNDACNWARFGDLDRARGYIAGWERESATA